MRSLFLPFALLVQIILCGNLIADDFEISKDSEGWGEFFDPPYKTPTELPKGELRSDLFNKLRPKISAKTKEKKILFEGSLKAYKNWAFFSGRTVDESGKSVKMPPVDNDDTVALWIRTADGWALVDYSGGHSDVFYIVWPSQWGVPKELLGFGE